MALAMRPNTTVETFTGSMGGGSWTWNPVWSLTGLPQLFMALERFEDRLMRFTEASIVDTGGVLVDTMKQTAMEMGAVDTGEMIASIASDERREGPRIIGIAVGPSVDYAKWVEFGTDDTRPKPFMRVAFDRVGQQIGRDLASAYQRNTDLLIREAASQSQDTGLF